MSPIFAAREVCAIPRPRLSISFTTRIARQSFNPIATTAGHSDESSRKKMLISDIKPITNRTIAMIAVSETGYGN